MLLTLSTTHQPATDLGYLLVKNPASAQCFDVGFGNAHVFYPEASDERCTAAMWLDIDPVGLVRGRGRGEGALDQYVNDRPYVASSFLSVALSKVLRSAMSGKSKERPELATSVIPLEASLSCVPCQAGEAFLRRLFEPLGYQVETERLTLALPGVEEGESHYFKLTLRGKLRLSELLTHLYVLIPVLDNQKHYWIADDELEKLLRHGGGWLEDHPERNAIVRRYLKYRTSLVKEAIARLTTTEEPDAEDAPGRDAGEEAVERTISLNEQRIEAVVAALRQSGARRVLDLGCGEGKLLRELLKDRQFVEIVGMDAAYRSLEIAHDRLKLDRMPENQRDRLKLIHGSLTYRDKRLEGYDAAAVVEVIEHLDPPRLAAFERVLFSAARPRTVVVTTPNREYNVRWATLPAGKFRHRDHRFEWTRAEFRSWAESVCDRFGYAVTLATVGPVDDEVGAPTQMAVFARAAA